MEIRLAILLVLCLPLLAAFSARSEADEGRARRAFLMRPGVVVDPAGPTIYAATGQKTRAAVEALMPGTGKVLWRTERAIRPITVSGGRLVAQAPPDDDPHVLVVVSLDVQDPDRDPRAAKIALPSGARPILDDALGESFHITGFEHGKRVILHWTHARQRVSGMPVRKPQGTTLEGQLAFDPATGTVTVLGDDAPTDPMAKLPAALEPRAKTLRIWAAGDTWVHVGRTEPGGDKQINVLRWNPRGEPLAPGRAFQVRDWLVELVSRDGRHLNAVTRRRGGTPFVDEFEWTLFDLTSGKPFASFPHQSSASPFVVLGDTVVHVAAPYALREQGKIVKYPLRLEGRRGDKTWSHPIRDTRYRGPMPPGGMR